MASIGEMSELNTIDATQFATLVDRLLAVSWPLPADRVTGLLQEWSWPVVTSSSDGGMVEADPGYGLSAPSPSMLNSYDGEVSDIMVNTSDYVDEPSDATKATLRDAFADHVKVITDKLGKPTKRSSGPTTDAYWELQNGARLTVEYAANGADVEIASPAEAALRREADAL